MKQYASLLIFLINCTIPLIAMEDNTPLVHHTIIESFIRQGNLEAFKTHNISRYPAHVLTNFMHIISLRSKAFSLANQLCEHEALFKETIATLERKANEMHKNNPLQIKEQYAYSYVEAELNKEQTARRGAVLGIIQQSIPYSECYYNVITIIQRMGLMEDKRKYINEMVSIMEEMGKIVQNA